MKNLHLLSILFVIAFAQITFSQKTDSETSKSFENIKSFPVVLGKKKDGLPQKITTRGIIEEFTTGFFSCGILHWHGTIKIRLLDKVDNYKDQHIYAVSSCFLWANKEVRNKAVEIKLTKLEKWEKQKYGKIVNTLDSNGLAFYNLDEIQISK